MRCNLIWLDKPNVTEASASRLISQSSTFWCCGICTISFALAKVIVPDFVRASCTQASLSDTKPKRRLSVYAPWEVWREWRGASLQLPHRAKAFSTTEGLSVSRSVRKRFARSGNKRAFGVYTKSEQTKSPPKRAYDECFAIRFDASL